MPRAANSAISDHTSPGERPTTGTFPNVSLSRRRASFGANRIGKGTRVRTEYASMSACHGTMRERCARSSSIARRAARCLSCHGASAATITLVSTATINSFLPDLLDGLTNLFVGQWLFHRFDRNTNGDASSSFDSDLPPQRLDFDMPIASRDLHRSAWLQSRFFEQLLRNGDHAACIECRRHSRFPGRNHTSANNAITRFEHSNNSPWPTFATTSSRAFGIAAAIARECSIG